MQLVILGRSGVISEGSTGDRGVPSGWRPIRGSLEAIARFHHAGWQVVVASNEPQLATGTMTPDSLARLHATLRRQARETGGVIDAVFYCPHAPNAGCSCHMPAPGLLHEIAGRMHATLDDVPVICDSLEEIQAARNAGALPLLVKTGRGFGTVSQPDLDPTVPVFNDLYGAMDYLLSADSHR
ncbi:MAG: HAD-IIIA family hydrolase [Thiohalobacterales bacterium]|nr:HAD-IIIA family hydrolase [Thiohalobacterales bacterium]